MAATTRHLVLAGAALVGAATAATSAVALYDLAARCGIPEPFAAALPIALDVGAAVGALAWIAERDQVQRWGRGVAIGGLVGTLAGNALDHALVAGLLQPTLPLVLVVGAAIPAMLWSVAHLAALMCARPAGRAPTRTPAPRKSRAARPAVPTVAPRVPAPPVASSSDVPSVGKRAAGIRWARAHLDRTGELPTGAAIAAAVGASKPEGDRIRARVKRDMEAAS